MKAVTIEPGKPGSLLLETLPAPRPAEGECLVQSLAVGICGTDLELVRGKAGAAPQARGRLVLGHESLARVVEAPPGELRAGDLVVGIVRHPDPEPCANCAAGEWDMCSNGRYTERGIRHAHGFCAEYWSESPRFLVKVDAALGLPAVLVEPASVLAKAWEHIEHIGRRARWSPRRLLVTGAGPLGLLAALMGVQRGLEVRIHDRNTDGPKPRLAADLGAAYSSGSFDAEEDVVIECTGAPAVVARVLGATRPNAIVCLTGLGASQGEGFDVAAFNHAMVMKNRVVFGSVNANRRHYVAAAKALAGADPAWLARLITRVLPLERWREAYERAPGQVKTVICLAH